MIADQGGQNNRNEKTIAILFAMFSTSVVFNSRSLGPQNTTVTFLKLHRRIHFQNELLTSHCHILKAHVAE